MTLRASKAAELFVWTDIESAFDDDFNRWYDREHMQERVSIPGFQWARRYRAVADEARRYLAIYRTLSISVFHSEAYEAAYQNQTDWSYLNFCHMHNTKRRVMAVPLESGFGAGAAVGLVMLNEPTLNTAALQRLLPDIERHDGVVRIHGLEPDPALSTPLPSEDVTQRQLEAAIIVDATTEPIAAAVAHTLTEELGVEANRSLTFRLLWSLDAQDLDTD